MKEITGKVNWPDTMEGMLELQRRFTICLAKIISQTMSLKQIDYIIQELEKHKWKPSPIVVDDEVA